MTLAELKKLLDATGYPVAYSHFMEPKPVPFICYRVAYSPNFQADNRTYHKIDSVDIELYTDKKDLVAEAALEAVLDANEIPYDSDETFIESEKLFQKIYEVRLI
ncbi:hypothetical protein NCCP2716_23520 [Sporosarcina sp. NCCP-2716]|uniref:hypothetical protein n=1 Tax=Sporosarcina sp. NCCP-2716 TaxID=2943679 RepID=UPI00203E5D20|nr:hypothetical protein [Sporosarcina sp. NCCP-2716]GKV69854.1 hypothetical protein NCCP2716_23520 [Sporosarcina sp. NCCP-2716]